MRKALPVLTVLAGIVAVWYAAAVWMNATWVFDQAARNNQTVTWGEVIPQTMAQERPLLPPPHQVAGQLWEGSRIAPAVAAFSEDGWAASWKALMHKRGLVYHGVVTLKGTIMGFVLGIALGVALAMAIVRFRVMDRSVMPWAIISQTIPIVALAPMILTVYSQVAVDARTCRALSCGWPRSCTSRGATSPRRSSAPI